jgi:hypothetical protein
MPHKRQMMLATKMSDTPAKTAPADGGGGAPLQAQALLDMAEAEAKMVHAVGACCPSPGDFGLGRPLPQEAAGHPTSDDSPPSMPSAPPPPKSRYPWNPAPSTLMAPPTHDARFLSYLSGGIPPFIHPPPPTAVAAASTQYETGRGSPPPTPKALDLWDAAAALYAHAAPPTHDADLCPQPSAPPLELLLMEEGFLTDRRATNQFPMRLLQGMRADPIGVMCG